MPKYFSKIKISEKAGFAALFIFLFGVGFVSAAWTPPAGNPPLNNLLIPLNVSSTGQSIQGDLKLNEISVHKKPSYFGKVLVGEGNLNNSVGSVVVEKKSFANRFCLRQNSSGDDCRGVWPINLPPRSIGSGTQKSLSVWNDGTTLKASSVSEETELIFRKKIVLAGGLRFDKLKSDFSSGMTSNKVLTLDANGNVQLSQLACN